MARYGRSSGLPTVAVDIQLGESDLLDQIPNLDRL